MTSKLPSGRVDVAYRKKLAASGVHGAVRWTAAGLPKGLALSSHGVLSGKPKKSGTFHIAVSVRDASGHHAKRHLLLVVKPAYPKAVSLSVGNTGGQTFTCVLTKPGAVECWGEGATYGELGNGSRKSSAKPVVVKGLSSGAKSVSAGTEFACAVTHSGAAKCWGWEIDGALGDGENNPDASRDAPVQVSGLTSGIRSVSAGGSEACAVTTGGGVKCWGQNFDGQLGSGGTQSESDTPVDVSGLSSGVASVSVGGDFACALTTVGGVECWGENDIGQLGDGNFDPSGVPADVTGLSSGVRSLELGGSSACAITKSGAAKCWGDNGMGELGDNKALADSDVPVAVHGLTSGQALVSDGDYGTACAVSTKGGTKCWGYNYDGTVGDGNDTDSYVPVAVKTLSAGVSAISAGEYTVCVVTTGGAVKCWGYVPTKVAVTDVPVTIPGFD
jgi:alpha-tubulin suppressor-like RCC1 family protein